MRHSICLLIVLVLTATGNSVADWQETFQETFEDGYLAPARWQPTSVGDFHHRIVDVVNVAQDGHVDYQLRLYADTQGTRDDTVKFTGVRSIPQFRLTQSTSIAVELDWNEQTNGSYLTAALVLSPHLTQTNPLQTPDWLKVEYVGVPPGKHARLVIAQKIQRRLQTLFTEGWPHAQRTGRKVTRQEIVLRFRKNGFEVWENERLQYVSERDTTLFSSAHLYLQLSSHSNYPGREVYFDNILIRQADSPLAPQVGQVLSRDQE